MDDLISRQAAIDAILKINDYGNSDRANALGLAECALTTLPSVQPKLIKAKIGHEPTADETESLKKKLLYAEIGLLPPVEPEIISLPSVQPEIIRCKDCKHRHIENSVWTCPFGLPAGPEFFCGYGAETRGEDK